MPRTRRPRFGTAPSRHRPRSNGRTRRWLAAVALGAIVGGLALAARATLRRPPAPPDVSSLRPLAPEIEDIVRQAVNSVDEDRRDGFRWGRLGMVSEANGLSGLAREAYLAATRLQASEAKWWFHLSVVDARLGHVDAAIDEMRRATELNVTYAPAYWRLGLLLLDQNQIDAAERAFNRATDIQPEDRAGWIGLARVYLQRGEDARAAGVLERLVSAGGDQSYVLQLLGTAYRRMGRADEAASAMQVGSKGEPQWSDPWTEEMAGFRRGYAALLKDANAYVAAGRFDEAIHVLEPLRRTRPDDVVLAAHLGQIYIAAGREDDAVPLLEQVIAKEPERVEAQVDLATGYMHQDHLAKARAAIDRALSIDRSFAPAHETLGLILWRGGDPRAAVASFETAVKTDPRNARALVWLGMTQTNLGRNGDALAAFERAAHVDPTNVDAWIGIANARLTLRDVDGAARALENARRLQPNRPAVKDTASRLQTLQRELQTRHTK